MEKADDVQAAMILPTAWRRVVLKYAVRRYSLLPALPTAPTFTPALTMLNSGWV